MVYCALVEMRMLWTEKCGKASHLPPGDPTTSKETPSRTGTTETARRRPMALWHLKTSSNPPRGGSPRLLYL